MRFNRIFVLILDSLGVGEALDANNYGDNGANTLKHIMDNYDLFIPNLKKLGFLNTINMDDNPNVEAYYTIARPTNSGKDSLSGHYEMFGIDSMIAYKTFAEKGFPLDLIEKIEVSTGKKVIGNKLAKGTDIINELGHRHIEFGSLIIYTTGDSTIEVAAHEDVIPVAQLYEYCSFIRKLTMNDSWRIARVIARPFTGKNTFKFTQAKKEFTLPPPKKSVLHSLKEADYSVISIGKLSELYDGQGITKIVKSSDTNMETLNKLTDIMDKSFTGVCITNLSEFDQEYAHKGDLEGFARAIEELDVEIPMVLNKLNNDDLLIITADHGGDPTMTGKIHTRENVPVLAYARLFKEPKKLDALSTYADIGATIADNFKVSNTFIGKSFLEQLK